jgi:hypothetical protein
MSAGGGSSQIYLNVCDPASDDPGLTLPLTATQFSSINQNQPDVAVGPTHTVVAWEQSSGGWEIQLSVAPHDALPGGLVDVAVPLSESLSGSNRHPDVAVHGSTVHVIWQNSADGTVKYLRGTLDGASALTSPTPAITTPRLVRKGPDLITLEGAAPGSTYRILASHGTTLHKGTCDPSGRASLPSRFLTPGTPLLVQAQTPTGPTLLRLGVAT